MKSITRLLTASVASLSLLAATHGVAANNHPQTDAEKSYYPIETIKTPEGVVFEAVGITRLPGDKLAICTRRGDIWIASNLFGDVKDIQFKRFATGLEEPLSLAHRDGWIYASEHTQISRMKDEDGDGVADIYETFNNDFGTTPGSTYHEFVFMTPEPDKDGNLWVALCLTGSSNSDAYLRGWAVRITPEGELIPTASGVRSPGGTGFNAEGDVFYCDNQGFWMGSSALKHAPVGGFTGNPSGNKWYDDERVKAVMGPRPVEPNEPSRIETERARIKEFIPPAVVFPHGKVGQSPTGIVYDNADGRFGPFKGQVFVGEQTHSQIQRVYLEKVNGYYQGAVFPFVAGFQCGIVGVYHAPEGFVFAGQTNRGWGSRGGQPYGLERVKWTGQTPFEVKTMQAMADGFRLTFTQPVDKQTAGDTASYAIKTWTYIYQSGYGSPEVDHTDPTITSANVSDDGLTVELKINGLAKGHVHHLQSVGVKNTDGKNLLHTDAYYTLNEIPSPRKG